MMMLRRVSERSPASQEAREALQAAHDALYKIKGRNVLTMSHGPFSGVNKALGLIAEMDEQLAFERRRLSFLSRAKLRKPNKVLRK